MPDLFFDVFENYRNNYQRILSLLYPSKNSTGFTERNLSVNFANAYERVNSSAITWFEFQFGENNNLHYDAVIIDPKNKRLLRTKPVRRAADVSSLLRADGFFALDGVFGKHRARARRRNMPQLLFCRH